MGNYADMSELLESDKKAMEFFNSLPVTLQRKMYERGVHSFEALYNSVQSTMSLPKNTPCHPTAASCNECTGLIPQGSGKTLPQWEEYGNLEHFGVPTRQLHK